MPADPFSSAAASEDGPDASAAAKDACIGHWDCFGETYCDGGRVWQTVSGTPCFKDGPCKRVLLHECGYGCAAKEQGQSGWPVDPKSFCNDNPKSPGDPCTYGLHCQPVAPPPDVTKTGAPIALTCDAVNKVCVSSSAPTLADYGADCGLATATFVKSKYVGGSGIVLAEKCLAQACVVAYTVQSSTMGTAPCLVQRCSKPCATGWDCPAGAKCVALGSLDKVSGQTSGGAKVCIAGALVQSFGAPLGAGCAGIAAAGP